MRVVLYTSNQPRHVACVEALQAAGHEVTAIVEPKTWHPGRDSAVLQRYWAFVYHAETVVFGHPRPIPCPAFVCPMGEASTALMPASLFDAERIVVFGSSFLKGPRADLLVEREALNLHIGMAPYYRGSACNFWAEFDGRPEYVGAQVQMLGTGIDAGAILVTSHGERLDADPFLRGMGAVREGIKDLVRVLKGDREWTRYPNDVTQTIRYSRGQDFTEQIAANYLKRIGR